MHYDLFRVDYISNVFSSLGTNLVIVFPGYSKTSGLGSLAMVNATLNIGSVNASFSGRSREVPILGTSHTFLKLRHWQLAQGRFLPLTDLDRATPVCVIGRKVHNELFGSQSPLGQWLHLGDRRFRVIGVLATEGRSIGVDVQDIVIIPVASAQQLFNTPSLFRILVEAKTALPLNQLNSLLSSSSNNATRANVMLRS